MSNYIICEGDITQTNNGLWIRCRQSDGFQTLTQTQFDEYISSITAPKMTFEQANTIGALIFMTWFAVWKGKQFAKLGDPSRSD